jgi:hypothetical protein
VSRTSVLGFGLRREVVELPGCRASPSRYPGSSGNTWRPVVAGQPGLLHDRSVRYVFVGCNRRLDLVRLNWTEVHVGLLSGHCVPAGRRPFWLVVAGTGFEPVKLSRRFYRPLPLAARATRLAAVRAANQRHRSRSSAPRVGPDHGTSPRAGFDRGAAPPHPAVVAVVRGAAATGYGQRAANESIRGVIDHGSQPVLRHREQG